MTYPSERRVGTVATLLASRQSRRDFLRVSGRGAVALVCGATIAPILGGCGNDDPMLATGDTTVDVDTSLAQFSILAVVGGQVALEGGDLFGLPPLGVLIRRDSAAKATVLDRTCTYDQCQVGPLVAGVTTCPCDGSQFSTDGGVLRGPAAFALTEYSSAIDGSIIRIHV